MSGHVQNKASDRWPASSEPHDRMLGDCWLGEVMPPTWAWAYRRLLDAGAGEQPRFTRRQA